MTNASEELFPLAKRRMQRRALLRLVLGLGLAGYAVVDYLGAGVVSASGGARLLLLPLGGGAFLITQGVLRLVAARTAAVRLTAEGVVFPPGIATLGANTVPYREIELLLAQGGNGRGRVVIGTRARVHVVDALDIGGLMTLKAFHERLRVRLAGSPGGLDHLTRIDKGLEVTRRLMGRRARVTEIILAVLIVAYLAEIMVGAVGPLEFLGVQPIEMIRMGAIVPPLITDQGQWFRLVTGTVLHAGILHIYLNGMAILALGGLSERLIGGYRLAIIYVVSAFAGSLSSAFVSGGFMSVGASGAVFGLLGGFGVLQLRHGRRLPPGIAQSRRWWTVILGLNAALPLALPMIDFWAHVGGFVGGAVVAGVLLRHRDAIRPDRPASFPVQGLAMALIGLSAAGLALGIDYARTADRSLTDEVRRAVEYEPADPALLNALAWHVAIDPEAPDSAMRLALKAADRGLAATPDDTAIRDTRATVLHRLGRHDEAIAEERVVLSQTPVEYYATQLLRFTEAALVEADILAGPSLGDLPRRKAWRTTLGADGRTLTLPDGLAGRDAAVMLAAVRADGVDQGLLRAHLVRKGDDLVAEPAESPNLPDGAVVVPLLFDAVADDETAEAGSWRYWVVDPEVTGLP